MREENEADYPSGAAAWMSQQMTIECLRHNQAVIRIAYEYEKRLAEERAEVSP